MHVQSSSTLKAIVFQECAGIEENDQSNLGRWSVDEGGWRWLQATFGCGRMGGLCGLRGVGTLLRLGCPKLMWRAAYPRSRSNRSAPVPRSRVEGPMRTRRRWIVSGLTEKNQAGPSLSSPPHVPCLSQDYVFVHLISQRRGGGVVFLPFQLSWFRMAWILVVRSCSFPRSNPCEINTYVVALLEL